MPANDTSDSIAVATGPGGEQVPGHSRAHDAGAEHRNPLILGPVLHGIHSFLFPGHSSGCSCWS
jgi:hypothetical protein